MCGIITKRKQKYLSPRGRACEASLTIEAAIVLPMFMFFVLGVISFMMLILTQADIQNNLEEAARTLSKKAYYLEEADIATAGLNPLVIKAALSNDDMEDTLERSGITDGIDTFFSTYDEETDILDIVVNYNYSIPFLPDKIATVRCAQRVRCRAWTGRELDESKEDEEEETGKTTVYVTETGTVYHLTKSCSYLDLSIRTIQGQNVEAARNKSGAKYYACPLCAKNASATGTLYVTDYGTNWHTSLTCSGLKRTVIEKDISEVEGMPACSKCGKKH